MKTTTELIRIASTGVSLVIDASAKTTTELMRVAEEVSKNNGHITFVNCNSKTTTDLLRLAQVCPGRITLYMS